jgi:hypothetical protein
MFKLLSRMEYQLHVFGKTAAFNQAVYFFSFCNSLASVASDNPPTCVVDQLPICRVIQRGRQHASAEHAAISPKPESPTILVGRHVSSDWRRIAPRPDPCLRSRRRKQCPRAVFCASTSNGISRRQGGHQLAHMLITSGLPCAIFAHVVVVLPSKVVTVTKRAEATLGCETNRRKARQNPMPAGRSACRPPSGARSVG